MSVSNDNTPIEQQRLKAQLISYACTYQLFYGQHETAQLLCGIMASLMKDAPLELKQEIMEYLKNSCGL